MAISRYQGHCRTSALEDDNRAGAVITPMTASVAPLARNIPSTPPRNKQVLGLITPLTTPDSLLRPNSSGFRFTSLPCTPTQRPDVPKDTTPLTVSGNPSECCSDQSIVIPFLPPAGLLTPDNTPPRLSKPRFVPISHKEETENKLESSLSLGITSTVVETSETGPQRHQSKDIAIKPTRDTSSQCHGLTLHGVQCQRSVKLPAQYCYEHKHQSNNTPTAPIAPQLTIAANSRCHGLTLRGNQCQRSIKPPVQYCYHHESQSTNTPTIPTAPKPTTVANSQCRGITLRGVQCLRSVKLPAHYCYEHKHQSNNTPTAPIAPQLTIAANSRCRGLTLRGNQCQRSIKPPAQYCYHHESQSTNTPTTPSAPKPTTDVNSQCCGLTPRGIRCQRSVKPSAQYCHQHRPQSNNHDTPTTPTTSTISTVQITVQCNVTSKSNGRRSQQRVSITPRQLTMDASQPIYCRWHIPVQVEIVTHYDGFKVQSVGQEGTFVHFCDYIPEYLQPDTQKKLRKVITGNISESSRIPGYVYALNVLDPENEGKLSLKIGYSKDVKRRHAEWKNKCRSSMKDVRGWWPQTIIEDKDDDEIAIQKLIRDNRQGNKGPMAEQLERLVHIELKDLATHAPYLHPNFPDVRSSDIPHLPKVVPKPCRDCSGTKHKEVFSFTRVKEGEFFGREWEDIVKPVIRKWGLFLMKYFAQDRMSFANDSRRT